MSKFFLAMPFLGGVALLISTAAEAEAVGFSAWILPIIVIIILIILNGIFVAAEFSIIGTRPSQLEIIQDENATAKRVLGIIESSKKQDQYIATAQLGITIASLGLAIYGEKQFEHLLVPYIERLVNETLGLGWEHGFIETITTFVIVLPIFTYLHVVFGEMVPKALALSRPVDTAIWLDWVMTIMRRLLTPLVFVLNAIGNGFLRLFNVPPAEVRLHSLEELEHLVEESKESGLLHDEEEEIIKNIFDFSERRVGQVMTPRPRVEAYPLDIEYGSLTQQVALSNHTRFPIYDREIDNIVGVLHLRDLIAYSLSTLENFDIQKLTNEILAVPMGLHVEEMLDQFRREHVHMAVVLDERGGMAGIVTLEDLIEEVVGEVRDEFDTEEEPLTVISENVIEVDGAVLLSVLVERGLLDSTDPLPDVETVGGLITTTLGGPAKIGDRCSVGPVNFIVMAVHGLAVTRARLEKES